MSGKINVTTKAHPDGQIEQNVDFMGHAMRWVVDTREQGIKDALMHLGWTPPKEVCRCSDHLNPGEYYSTHDEGEEAICDNCGRPVR